MLNLNLGRTLFINGGKSEVKILTSKPDLRGMYVAQITDLTTGVRHMVPVKLHGRAEWAPKDHCQETRALRISIHA